MRFLLRWLVPPLLGAVGFVASREISHDGPEAVVIAERQEPGHARPGSAGDLQQDLEKLREQWELADGQEAEEIVSLTVAALRTKIEELLKKCASFNDETEWPVVEKTEKALLSALFELGKREGQAALEWIKEGSPEHRGQVMAGWAEADPDAALRAVIASKRKPPCFPETVMQLLQYRAAEGPDALREACSKVPWELILIAQMDPFKEGFALQPDTDVRPWIESGAAEAMARDGITIPGLFTAWAAVDPAQALAKLDTWEDPRRPFPSLVHDLLRAGVDKEDVREKILHGLEALPEEELTRISDGLEDFGKENSGRREALLKLYPILERTTPDGG